MAPLRGKHGAAVASQSEQRFALSLERLGKARKHWASRPQKPLRLVRDGEVGGSGISYLTPTRYTVTTRMIVHEGGQLCEPF